MQVGLWQLFLAGVDLQLGCPQSDILERISLGTHLPTPRDGQLSWLVAVVSSFDDWVRTRDSRVPTLHLNHSTKIPQSPPPSATARHAAQQRDKDPNAQRKHDTSTVISNPPKARRPQSNPRGLAPPDDVNANGAYRFLVYF